VHVSKCLEARPMCPAISKDFLSIRSCPQLLRSSQMFINLFPVSKVCTNCNRSIPTCLNTEMLFSVLPYIIDELLTFNCKSPYTQLCYKMLYKICPCLLKISLYSSVSFVENVLKSGQNISNQEVKIYPKD